MNGTIHPFAVRFQLRRKTLSTASKALAGGVSPIKAPKVIDRNVNVRKIESSFAVSAIA